MVIALGYDLVLEKVVWHGMYPEARYGMKVPSGDYIYWYAEVIPGEKPRVGSPHLEDPLFGTFKSIEWLWAPMPSTMATVVRDKCRRQIMAIYRGKIR